MSVDELAIVKNRARSSEKTRNWLALERTASYYNSSGTNGRHWRTVRHRHSGFGLAATPLAGKLGLDPTVVETSVHRYNEACADGVDHSFGRNPETLAPVATAPFYAVSGPPLLGWSSGGPRRDGHSRVLDTAGSPIPGLYAAGAVSSTYSAAKDGGFHIADAFAFGRVAGAHAAARATAGD
ncbi:FAD-binding protein [Rhodococcus sp. MS13]|uniref:FAD-binding protein n=1 Tax=Rhodococcus sp. MS13 TaxID=2579940 RepID=UPI001F5BFC5C|nr:FAD-binding protein [Rhodococcus sp. MS13]